MMSRALFVVILAASCSAFPAAISQRTTATGTAGTPTRNPPTLGRARTLFLINEASPERNADLEFGDLRAQLRRWNRFELVDRAERADITMALGTKQIR